jgi:hypothetical protein
VGHGRLGIECPYEQGYFQWNVGLRKEVDWNGRRIRTAMPKARVAGASACVRPVLKPTGKRTRPVTAAFTARSWSTGRTQYRHWADEFGQLGSCGFGENLTISVLDESRDEIA